MLHYYIINIQANKITLLMIINLHLSVVYICKYISLCYQDHPP
jgi:hypothetical protein